MNVLGKIVIPRSMMSIQYILETLEEMAREDFYRLKKILKNKRKKIYKSKHEDEQEEAINKCVVCGASIDTDDVSEEIAKTDDNIEEKETKLEELKAQIGELVEMTKEIKDSCLFSESVKDFLKTAEQLKEKLEEKNKVEPIPSETLSENLCVACKKRFKYEQRAKNLMEEREKSLDKESMELDKSVKQPDDDLCELHAHMETDLELGTFETEIQEIIKVIRVRNEDGSVSEEKKIIKIKREIRAPGNTQPLTLPAHNQTNERVGKIMYQSSKASNKSNPFTENKTVGITHIMVKDSKVIRAQRVKSEALASSPPMADLAVRSCISSMSFITLDSSNTLSFFSSAETMSFDKIRELAASSTKFEEILRLFEPHTQKSKTTSTENIELRENSDLTESERNLIMRITDDDRKAKLRSKSNNNYKDKNKLKINTSFNDKNNNDDDANQSNNN